MRKLATLAAVLGLTMMMAPSVDADSSSRPLSGSVDGSVSFILGTECQNYGGLNVRTDGFTYRFHLGDGVGFGFGGREYAGVAERIAF